MPNPALLTRALRTFESLDRAGRVRNRLLTVIDYSLPSSERRLWVVDPRTSEVLFHEFVAHGRGSADPSNPDLAVRFGNAPSSKRTSLGTFLTGDTYTGEHGHSLELDGLERGVNDLARRRRIVIHPADYVGAEFRRRSGGRVGRSFGCPALDPSVAVKLIDRIRGGSVIVAAAEDRALARR